MIFCVTDIETTGIDPAEHAIVEIACRDVDGGPAFEGRSSLVFPGRDIPPEASAIHHLIEEDVRLAPRASEAVPPILRPERDDVIYVAHNASFEQAFLHHYLPVDARWLCTYRAALRVWPDAPGHSNQILRYWRKFDLINRNYADQTHRAGPDVYVTCCLLCDLLRHANVEDMLAWSKEPPMFPTCPIGRKQGWYGKPWSEIDNGALIWIVNTIEDNPDVVWNARYHLEERAKAQQAIENERKARMREAYVLGATAAIRTARTVKDLEDWWRDPKCQQHRAIHEITKGTPEYAKLAEMCAKKKADLLAGVEEKLRPAERRMAA